MWTRRLRSPLVAAVGAGVLLVLGVVALLSRSGEPESLQDLSRAEKAGDRARATSEELAADLQAISENLKAGFDLPEKSSRIHALTEKQAASLDEVARVLRRQIDHLENTLSKLRSTRETAASMEDLSSEQSQLIDRTVATLRQLRALVHDTSATSLDLARFARFGARLAKDSQRSFSTP
jgi:methyl-accepting chemotaxis protein